MKYFNNPKYTIKDITLIAIGISVILIVVIYNI